MTGDPAPRHGPDGRLLWSRSSELTGFEALMWRVEADPRMRSTVVIVETLDREPDWDRMVAATDWASRVVPRLRERIVAPFLGAGTPFWSLDPDFDLHYHLRRLRLHDGASGADLFRAAEQVAMTPLDPSRPLWEATIVGGLPDGGAALLFKLSHVLSDGMGLAQLLAGLHSRTREPTPDKPQPPAPEPTPTGPVEALVRQARTDLGLVTGVARGLLGGASALVRPDRALRDAAGYVASAVRVLSPPTAPPLPVLARRSPSWRFRARDVPFAELRAAGRAGGGSVNSAFVAALLAAFRRYSARCGEPLPSDRLMPVTMPVSVRREEHEAGGNHFAPARLSAPVGLVDPAARIADVHHRVATARAEPALESVELVAPLLVRLPGALVARFGGSTTGANDLQASSIPGLQGDVYLAGARIVRSYPFAPLPGCAAMIAMITHGDVCCVAANLDAAAITDLAGFEQDLADGFDEVLALAR
ncbi:wax ester/triacylglycerol synthase domain-containing protein [Actinomycetospora soli]|uniref:wax ester/triacylglycerol synthase domain-containing protein n=1 Tax=Actinomycetospora soli TaxID=2893887 RepID=UPI001E5633A3|nr:wax ester/triacylglycerol synthase domain-containing protein [Actinomycetospora soli]MCD2189729.1 WS/DGAT domain-containing protein [Actinomycetospora soli]